MKKILIILLFLFVGCSNKLINTPTKKVELMFQKYQTLDKEVVDSLDNLIDNDLRLNENQKMKYKDIMKRHYQNIKYEIKDEIKEKETAIVTVEIEVTDYTKVLENINKYKEENIDEFYKNGVYNEELFNDYRLNKLAKVEDKVKYIIDITLTKIKGEWTIDHIPDEIVSKIQGVYTY